MAEQVVTEFKQLIRQAGLTTRSASDNIHLIGLFRKALNHPLAHKIMFGGTIPRTIEDWFEKRSSWIQTIEKRQPFSAQTRKQTNLQTEAGTDQLRRKTQM